jgi:hypothetical protein
VRHEERRRDGRAVAGSPVERDEPGRQFDVEADQGIEISRMQEMLADLDAG